MQTTLSPEFQATTDGRRAGEILRKCVHCGFCNATCPTYELLGDELDGPRGRIYQMKQLFEDGTASRAMRLHLDRCLFCRSCETTCPSGVEYGSLLEISKTALDEKLPRTVVDRARRALISRVVASPGLFAPLLWLGRAGKRILPGGSAGGLAGKVLGKALNKVPDKALALELEWPQARHSRRMIALAGCVQSVVGPNTNLAAAVVLDRLGISLIEVDRVGCCGGVRLHTLGDAQGRQDARRVIDRWLPYLDGGKDGGDGEVEAIVMTASGCGLTLADYPRLFEDDPEYHEKALRVSRKSVDLSEIIARELPPGYSPTAAPQKVAFHSPCTLQHGQRVKGSVEAILEQVGHNLCEVRDSHLCCGSAGTYSILQPTISAQLRRNKQAALTAAGPDVVCTANIGCQLQLGVDSRIPVRHWIELLV